MWICPICRKEIKGDERKHQISSDKPYFNIYAHKDCYEANKHNINDFLKDADPLDFNYKGPAKYPKK